MSSLALAQGEGSGLKPGDLGLSVQDLKPGDEPGIVIRPLMMGHLQITLILAGDVILEVNKEKARNSKILFGCFQMVSGSHMRDDRTPNSSQSGEDRNEWESLTG